MSSQTIHDSPSPIACLGCRKRHAKCDAAEPKCTRCTKGGRECVYIASRRGCRGSSRRTIGSSSPDSTHSAGSNASYFPPPTSLSSRNTLAYGGQTPLYPVDGSRHVDSHNRQLPTLAHSAEPDITTSNGHTVAVCDGWRHHVDLYYRHFHKAHPILLPQHFSHLRPWPWYLRDVASLIGSQYCAHSHELDVPSFFSSGLDIRSDKTVEMVQARVLAVIFLHACARPEIGLVQLDKALDLALDIGLDSEWFAAAQGLTHPMLAESVRRTWWELHTVDSYIAGFHHRFTFRTLGKNVDVCLPCEEHQYESGSPPKPYLTFKHLDRRVLMDDGIFSSYALRIEAVSIGGRALAANDPASTLSIEELESLDGLLSTWCSTLPDTKPIVDSHGQCDELIYQAHLFIHMTNICFQLPRSGIFSFMSSTEIACAKANEHLPAFLDLNTHAGRAMNAAKSLTALESIDVGDQAHTPVHLCSLVLIALVHLSVITLQLEGTPKWQFDRVCQTFGLIRSESKTWPFAASAYVLLKKIASAASSEDDSAIQPSAELTTAVGEYALWFLDGRCNDWHPAQALQGIDALL